MMRAYLTLPIFALVALILLVPHEALAARLFSSGCEFQGDAPGNAIDGYEWERSGTSNSSTQISTTIKRSGLSSCRTYAPTSAWAHFDHDYSTGDYDKPMYYRFYINVQTMPTELVDILSLDSSGSTVGTLILNPDGKLSWEQWVEDSTPDFNTPGPVIFTNTWQRIEVKFNGDDRITVRVDGINVLDVDDNGSDDTRMFHSGLVCDHYCGGDGATTADIYFDDFALNDSEGAFQNSWPGPGAIVHMQPNGSGDNSQCFVGSVNSVDEITPENPGSPSAATICSLDSPGVANDINSGDILDVNVESPTSAGIDSRDQVAFVSVGIRERPASSGNVSYRLRLKSGAGLVPTTSPEIIHNGTSFSTNGEQSSAPNNYALTAYKDPTTLCSWTQMGTSSVDNMQIGVSTIDNSPDQYVDILWALVEYTPKFVEPCGKAYGGNTPDAISSALSLSPEYVQKKYGNFWAASIATDKICLGSGANCTTTWNRTPKCRLEHHRVTARPNASNFPSWGLPDFSVNVATSLCDDMLTAASKTAGWVSTGYDKSLRVFSNDGHTPSVCQFTRLVCDPNVELLPPTVTGPSVYPVADFTTSSNQCSDRLDNDNDNYYDMNDGDCIGWSDNSETGTSGGGGGGGCGSWGCNEN